MDDMQGGKVISVQHEVTNGWHEFTCPQVPGFHLIAESADLETAYAQVPDAIAEIIDADDRHFRRGKAGRPTAGPGTKPVDPQKTDTNTLDPSG